MCSKACVSFLFFGWYTIFWIWKFSLSQAELMKLKSEFPPCFPKSYLGKKNISGRNSYYLNGRSFGTSNLNHRTTHGGFVVGQLYPPKPWRPWPPLSTEPQLRLNPRAPPADTPAAAPEGESKWRKLRPSVKSGGFCRTQEAAKWIFFVDKLCFRWACLQIDWCSEIQCVFVSFLKDGAMIFFS